MKNLIITCCFSVMILMSSEAFAQTTPGDYTGDPSTWPPPPTVIPFSDIPLPVPQPIDFAPTTPPTTPPTIPTTPTWSNWFWRFLKNWSELEIY